MLSIGITTFKRRLELVKNLIKSIRSIDEDIEIIVTVNADYKQDFDENYRKNLCEFFAGVKNCYPARVLPVLESCVLMLFRVS